MHTRRKGRMCAKIDAEKPTMKDSTQARCPASPQHDRQTQTNKQSENDTRKHARPASDYRYIVCIARWTIQ